MTPFDLDALRAQEPQLRRLARAIVGEAYADDVVQDAWTAALAHRGDAPDSWGAWLNRVTRNLAWKRRKRDGNERARALAAFGGDRDEPPADDVVARVEEKHVLEKAILELDEPYCSVLLWRYYEDLSVEEVSRRAGTVPSTTRTHLQRGLALLRARLKSEKGPEWRMALIPFLRPKASTVKAAAAAGASGIGTMTVFKLMFAAIVAATLGGLILETLQDSEGRGLTLVDLEVPRPSGSDSSEYAALSMVEPEAPTTSSRAATEAEVAPEVSVGPAAAEDTTTLQLVDFESLEPLPGVTFEANYQVQRRKFFFTVNEGATLELTTDSEGRAILPAASDAEGKIDGNPIRATVTPTPTGDLGSYSRKRYLQVLDVLEDGTVLLSPEPSAAFWVRVPDKLEGELSAAVEAKLMIESLGTLKEISYPFAPLAARGRDLLFLFPRYIDEARWEGQEVATLHIATTNEGPSYRADIQRVQNLGDEPRLAERYNDSVQRMILVDEETGAPIKGAHMSINSSTKGKRGHGDRFASATTNEAGRAKFIGVPHGALFVHATCEGYERLAVQREFTRFESATLKMRRRGGLRSVKLTLKSKKGSSPIAIDLSVYDNVDLGPLERIASIDCQRKGAGWVGSVVLEHVPSRPVFLDLGFYTWSYDRLGPIRIDPDQTELTIDVGEGTPLLGLRLRVPDGVEAEYRQRIESGREYSFKGPHLDGAGLTSVPDDGRTIHWTMEAPGFVPVKGTRADFTDCTHEGERCLELWPTMVEGSGTLFSAEWWAPVEGIPYHFNVSQPIEGVRFSRTDTGELLGITDASGYVIVSTPGPHGKVTATYKGQSQTREDTQGFPRFGFTFKR